MKNLILFLVILNFLVSVKLSAQTNPDKNQFRQLGTLLPDANSYRTASGAPGYKYWQQNLVESRFELYKKKNRSPKNPVQKKK